MQVVKQEGRPVPGQRKETISTIEKLGIVDHDLADRLREAVGFRDVLAHTDGPIVNDELVYDALQHGLDRYVAFVEAIREYMSQFNG